MRWSFRRLVIQIKLECRGRKTEDAGTRTRVLKIIQGLSRTTKIKYLGKYVKREVEYGANEY